MGYLDRHEVDLGADSQADGKVSIAVLQRRADNLAEQIAAAESAEPEHRFGLMRALAEVQTTLKQGARAWQNAMAGFQHHIERHDWEAAVLDCDCLFRTGEPDALIALGHGLWLSVTFPIDPELTVLQLRHVIDETPADSDGAAVAAAMASWVVELRSERSDNDDATLVVGQLLNDVARRHGNVETTADFEAWFQRLELGDPAKLAIRMRNIIDVVVQDQWWIDRPALQALIPDDA